MSVTKNLANYIKDKGINLAFLSRKTNIPYPALYSSLGSASSNDRELRADELLGICAYLKINPLDYADMNIKSDK